MTTARIPVNGYGKINSWQLGTFRKRPLNAAAYEGRRILNSSKALAETDAPGQMATAVLILDRHKRVEFANMSAEALFGPINPVGCTLPALFASCDASGAVDLFATVDWGEEQSRVQCSLAHDRMMDCIVRPLASGGFVLTMDDVTTVFRNAASAGRDPLTGLISGTKLRSLLAERLAQAARTGAATSVLFIDLDRFRTVNETLGHAIGDALLCEAAERLRRAINDGDLLARIGGDAFAIVQSQAPQPFDATALAARLIDVMAQPYVVGGHTLEAGAGAGVSVGIAIAPDDGDDPQVLLEHAELALGRAKAEEGGGTIRFFERALDERMQARRAMEIDLRHALALNQLDLVYQPQFNIVSSKVVGFEALIRWHHPVRGIVSPAEFIPLAEEIGVINAIGSWVLRTACKQAASWPLPVCIAVNVSPCQFRNGTLLDTVLAALSEAQLPATRLELEITEGALLTNTGDVLQTLKRLRELGITTSMDDFGTGYSSLGYLQKFPFDKIKIDQSFVRGVDARADRQAFIRAVNSLAAMHGIKTVGEGVETEAELACLRAQGCDEVQGYLTGPPASAESAKALLSSASEQRAH